MTIGIISLIREAWGGSEFLWAAMANEALEEGHSVVLSRLNTGPLSSQLQHLQSKGLIICYRRGFIKAGSSLPKRALLKTSNYLMEYLQPSLKNLLSHQPDVIIYVGSGLSAKDDNLLLKPVMDAKAALVTNVQLGTEGGRLLTETEYRFLQNFYQKTAANYFVSKRNLVTLEKQLAIAIPNAHVIRNPVNLNDISLLPMPSISGTIQFATVGNLLVCHKGQDSLLSTLATDKWKNRNWQLNIFGDGIDKIYLQELVTHYQLGDKVFFKGKVADIRKVWEQNHALLMPSIMEGMPLAVVEAMLCGRPVVATDVGGIADWIDDGENGFIAATSSEAALDVAIEKLWNAMSHWQSLGKAAHEKALGMYDRNCGKTFLTHIKKVVSQN